MTFQEFNNQSKEEAQNALEKCCVSKIWVLKIMESMPFNSENELIQKAAKIWFEDCSVEDYKEAFAGHPKIGDVNSLKEKFSNTKNWANNEQSKMMEANQATIEVLAKANRDYEIKFGYIFIVSASGKSAEEMLAIIQARLHHKPKDEIHVAMNEQHKITVIRLAKLIEDLSKTADLRSHLTTHALDTSIGIPANNMVITLKNYKGKPMSVGITNSDGRISDVLPAGRYLKPDNYTMTFNTKNYYESHGQKGFYPEVAIQFTVTDKSHYHIPLLINPFGYSTYRGS